MQSDQIRVRSSKVRQSISPLVIQSTSLAQGCSSLGGVSSANPIGGLSILGSSTPSISNHTYNLSLELPVAALYLLSLRVVHLPHENIVVATSTCYIYKKVSL